MKLTYSIYYPGGNTTALVYRLILDPALKRQINDKIMSKNPQVEQVGFIDPKNYRMEMAGGEFCGNATRCATYYYLKGQPGKIQIKVSGVKQKLTAGIDNNNNIWAEMPVKFVAKKCGYNIVVLEGITQVITTTKPSQKKAKDILQKLNLLTSVPAAGVMFIKKYQGKIKLNPFVWVRDIKTFFNETACASGSAATGAFLAKMEKNKVKVIQPSGSILTVTTIKKSQNIIKSKISGPVSTI